MDLEERLNILMVSSEEAHDAVGELLEGLKVERAALARERAALATERAALQESIKAAVREAVSAAGREAFRGSTEAAAAASAKLSAAAQWLSVRLLAACGAGLLVLGGVGFVYAEYLTGRIRDLQEELPVLEARAADWEAKGGDIALTVCGPKKRPCAKADVSARYGDKDSGYYYILLREPSKRHAGDPPPIQ